jgi:hypothetical protein
LGEDEKAMYKGSPDPADSFSVFCPAENTTWTRRRRIFKQVDRSCELIFVLLAGAKRDFCEFERSMFEGSPAIANTISAFWPVQNTKCTSLRKRYFKGSPGPAKSFSAFCPTQNAMRRRRESDVSTGYLVLRPHFLPSSRPIMLLVWIEKAMFQVVAWTCELILYLLDRTKRDF